VLVEGHDILEEPEAARANIGYLPELPPLYPDMTVTEYLRFCAELKKIPREQREDQLQQVLALTHLEDMRSRLIRNLSKGYRQRVGLAQAILGFPKIIILDEPTVGLDPKQVVEIRDLIRHLAREHTVIISSHILSEIRAVCDHVLIIRKGKFVVCDTPEDLEEKLSAGGSLELTAKAAPEAAEAVLDRVSGVTAHTLLGQTEDASRFSVAMDGDVREALFYAFAEAKLPLLELRPRMASLEEVFLDLTDDDDTVAAQAAALFQAPAAPAGKEGTGDEGDL
jgi:ABC-2 type transport system ATP-binding protein